MKRGHLLNLLALSISTACHGEVYPAPIGPSQLDFGSVGLLQTPTTRIAREGGLDLNYQDSDQYRYYSASVQLSPWLETALRYTDMHTRWYSSVETFSDGRMHKDRAFDLKPRLRKENYWLPQVAVGARGTGGVGLLDAEYLVASETQGPFDFTLGLDWEYLGTSGNMKNPPCLASDRCCYRDNSHKRAESIDGSQMFRSPASLFGGVEYQALQQLLRLKLGYEGNNYQWDFTGKLERKSKFNVGAVYHVVDQTDISLSYEHGNASMFDVTLHTNFNNLRPPYNDDARPQYQPQPQDVILRHSVVVSQLTPLKYNARLADPQIQAGGGTLYVTGEQVKHRDSREGVIRANQVVMDDLSDGIETIHITENRLNVPQVTTGTDVTSSKNHLAGEPLGRETKLTQKHVESVVPKSTRQGWYIDKSYFNPRTNPVLNQSVGNPENFYTYQLGMMGTVDLWLTGHLLTTGNLLTNLANNYDKFGYTSPSQDLYLPCVHTHMCECMQNDVYVDNLQANYFQHLGSGFYGQVYDGYFETMFGNAGAGVLYRPLDSSWAFGLDAGYVRQRDWCSAKDMMEFTDYSVKAGHLTTYWAPSLAQDVLVKASVGQYLVGDKGSTLEIAKYFDNGAVIGGYTTITSVSKEEHSEGDFTRGVYVLVSLDLFSSGSTCNRAVIGQTPLTYDGDQQFGRKSQLYDMTNDRSVNSRQVMGKVPVFMLTGTSILNGLLSHQERNSPPVCDLVCKDESVLSSYPSMLIAGLVA